MRRARGVRLTRLDFSALAVSVRRRYGIPPNAAVAVGHDYALGRHAGRLYVIRSDGIGWEVTTKPLRLDVFVASRRQTMIAAPYEVSLEREEIVWHEQPQTGCDLADFVRTNGARLEARFWAWHGRLTA